jgi:hypothetical protein
MSLVFMCVALCTHTPVFLGSCTCLVVRTGAAPVFISDRALEKLQKRKTVPATYNLDLNLVRHTARGLGRAGRQDLCIIWP